MPIWVAEWMDVPTAGIIRSENTLTVLDQGVCCRLGLLVVEDVNEPAWAHIDTQVD